MQAPDQEARTAPHDLAQRVEGWGSRELTRPGRRVFLLSGGAPGGHLEIADVVVRRVYLRQIDVQVLAELPVEVFLVVPRDHVARIARDALHQARCEEPDLRQIAR